MKTFVISNRKGGVGKTTTAYNLAAGLTLKGYKVLAIDLDSQCSLTASVTTSTEHNGMDLLLGKATAAECIQRQKYFDFIPASLSLGKADNVITDTGKEYRLKEALHDIQSQYDYAVIDTPSALDIVTINALTAADYVIISAAAEDDSITGIELVCMTMQTVKKYTNKRLELLHIVIANYDGRTNFAKDMRTNLENEAKRLDVGVTTIHRNSAVAEAKSRHKSIFDYDRRSRGAQDYGELVNKIEDYTK